MITETRKDFRPWDGIGVTVKESMTTAAMLKAAKLDWTISKQPLHHVDDQGDPHQFRGIFGLLRDDDLSEIGVCGPDYQPIQNAKAFEFFEKFIERGDMRMEAVGSFRGAKGLHIWALASLKHEFVLPGDDVVKGHILLSHPHIWGQTLQIKPTAMRIYCYNSLMAALRAGEDCFKHWHNREFGDAAVDKAQTIVAATIRYMGQVREKAEFLASRPARIPQIAQYVAELFQPALLKIDGEIRAIARDEVVTTIDPIFFGKTSYKVWESVFKSPGAHSKAAEGTWWGVANGVTHAVDHTLGRSREIALCDAWLGSRATKKNEAFDLAVEYAKNS